MSLHWQRSEVDSQMLGVIYDHSIYVRLQCFDAVGWAAGRASSRKKLSGEVLAWLSVWSEVQTCTCPADATATHYLLLQ